MAQTIIALGFFDGVHLGHQAILHRTAQLAQAGGLASAAITFQNHPRSFLQGRSPQLITSIPKRRRLIEQAGVQAVFVLPFDQQMADTPAEQFATDLVEKYGAVAAVCGESFRFGKNAEGQPQLLRDMGLEVHICPGVLSDQGEVISSTAIRALVREGEMEKAARYLGRPFSIEGPVAHGHKVGRRLGFPTLNQVPDEAMLLPRRGVYAGQVVLPDGSAYPALTNVGSRPTFTSADIVSVESHLLDFEGDLYGLDIETRLLRFIRPERTFGSAEALQAQIARDVDQARATPGR